MTKEEFWTQKKSSPEYWTVTFSHPDFGVIRLAANQFEELTLGGNVYTPCGMSINPPEESRTSEPQLSVSFPRIKVGRDFKKALAQISLAGQQIPVNVNFSKWIDTIAPIESHDLYLSDSAGVTFNTESVQVKANDDNSIRRDVSATYTVEEFTGLIQI
jgi:hypothetical protein